MNPHELERLLSDPSAPKGAAFLAQMARESARRASSARAGKSEAELRRMALDRTPCRRILLHESGFDVIAEVKFSSPSEGALTSASFLDGRSDPHAALLRAGKYAEAGACAISVLTEPFAFRGSLEHLRRVAEHSSVPVMRKDFLVDTYQVWEARADEADGVLLVVRIVDDERLQELLDACEEAGVFALVEAFDEEDLARASAALAKRRGQRILVGVNNRDLDTLQVDLSRCTRLADRLPAAFPAVAESGLLAPRDAQTVAQSRYDLALVGSALMRSDDPVALIHAFLAHGRRARAGGAS